MTYLVLINHLTESLLLSFDGEEKDIRAFVAKTFKVDIERTSSVFDVRASGVKSGGQLVDFMITIRKPPAKTIIKKKTDNSKQNKKPDKIFNKFFKSS